MTSSRRNRRLTASDVKAILHDIRRGYSYDRIGAKYKISIAHIKNICYGLTWTPVYQADVDQYGPIPPRPRGRPPLLSAAQIANIRIAFRQGVTSTHVAAFYHVSISTILGITSGRNHQDVGS